MTVAQKVLLIAACGLSAMAGALLKRAADSESLALLALSLGVFSLSSLAVFGLYRSGADSLALVTFASLLGTVLCAQLVATFWLGEPVNIRALAVMVVAVLALSWAVAPAQGGVSPDTSHSSQINKELRHGG